MHYHQVNEKKNTDEDDCHFNLAVIIEEIIVPWINGGADILNTIAKGIEKLEDFHGYGGHGEMMVQLLGALSAYQKGGSGFYPECMSKHLKGINTLYQIGFCFYDYKIQEEKKEEQLKIAS